MYYRILIVRNGGLPDIAHEIGKLREWIMRKTPLIPQIDFLDVSVPLAWKPFTHIEGKNYVGLDGIKERLDGRTDIVYGYYQAIIFMYSTKDYVAEPGTVLCCWTYPNSFLGAPFIEVFHDPVTAEFMLFPFMAHELVHAMHRRLWNQRIMTVDDMDLYDGYREPYGENNSYTRNLERLQPHWKKVAEEASYLTLARMRQMLAILLGKTR